MHSEIKGFRTIVREILSEICEDPTYARFTVLLLQRTKQMASESRKLGFLSVRPAERRGPKCGAEHYRYS